MRTFGGFQKWSFGTLKLENLIFGTFPYCKGNVTPSVPHVCAHKIYFPDFVSGRACVCATHYLLLYIIFLFFVVSFWSPARWWWSWVVRSGRKNSFNWYPIRVDCESSSLDFFLIVRVNFPLFYPYNKEKFQRWGFTICRIGYQLNAFCAGNLQTLLRTLSSRGQKRQQHKHHNIYSIK